MAHFGQHRWSTGYWVVVVVWGKTGGKKLPPSSAEEQKRGEVAKRGQ